MTWLNRLSPQARTEVRQARKAQAQATKAEKLQRARLALASVMPNARKPRDRDNEHLKFIRRCPCIVCVIEGLPQETPTRAAHIRCSYPEDGWTYTGKAEKPSDWRTAPICDWDHTDGPQAQHRSNERDWWQALGIYPPDLCAELVKARKSGADPAETIAAIAAQVIHDADQ